MEVVGNHPDNENELRVSAFARQGWSSCSRGCSRLRSAAGPTVRRLRPPTRLPPRQRSITPRHTCEEQTSSPPQNEFCSYKLAGGKVIADSNYQHECSMRPHATHTGNPTALAHNPSGAGLIFDSRIASGSVAFPEQLLSGPAALLSKGQSKKGSITPKHTCEGQT